MARFIALDIGNVCLKIDPEPCIRYFGLQEFTVMLLPTIVQLECGKISEAEMFQQVRSLFSLDWSEEEILTGWNSILGPEIPRVGEKVRSWKQAGYEVIFFSDTSALHLQEVLKRLSFSEEISGGVYSFETGAQKPSDVMYEAFEQRYGVPEWYFDDRLCNIEGARKRGWNARQIMQESDLPFADSNGLVV